MPPMLTHEELRRHENSHARALDDKTGRSVAATLILDERRLCQLGKMRNAAMWTGRRRRGGRTRQNAAAKLTLKAWTRHTRWYVLYIKDSKMCTYEARTIVTNGANGAMLHTTA